LAVTYPASLRAAELPAAHVAAVGNDFRRLTAFARHSGARGRRPQLRRKALSLVSLGWRGRDNQEIVLVRTPLTASVDRLYGSVYAFRASSTNLLAKSANLPSPCRRPAAGRRGLVEAALELGPVAHRRAAAGHAAGAPEHRGPGPGQAVANGDAEIQVQLTSPRGALLHTSTSVQVRV
jgi:hypothetical protein